MTPDASFLRRRKKAGLADCRVPSRSKAPPYGALRSCRQGRIAGPHRRISATPTQMRRTRSISATPASFGGGCEEPSAGRRSSRTTTRRRNTTLLDVPKFAQKADGVQGCAIMGGADEGEMMGVNSRVELCRGRSGDAGRLRHVARKRRRHDRAGDRVPVTRYRSGIWDADRSSGVSGLASGHTRRCGDQESLRAGRRGGESGAVVGPHARLRPAR